jgi:hypothetical protein
VNLDRVTAVKSLEVELYVEQMELELKAADEL